MQFIYDACTPDGNKVHGKLRAKSLEEAQGQLHQQGLLVISLKACRSRARLLERLLLSLVSTGSKLQFLSRFVRQLSNLSRVGLPFLTCLQIITDETKQPLYKRALTELGHDVAQGKSLAKAISKQDHLFPPLLVQMTAAAEAAGKLEEVYDQLADTYQQELELRRKIAAVAAYPVLVLSLALVGAVVVSRLAVPHLEELLAYSGASLPLLTKMLLLLGQPSTWHVLLVLIGVLIVLSLILWLTPSGTRIRNLMLLRTPVLGSLILRFHLARTCHVLSLCLGCGIPLLTALSIAEQAALIQTLSDEIKQLRAGSQLGLSLTSQLRTIKAVPSFLVQMVRVGEETGCMPEMLQQVGNILGNDVRHSLTILVAWLEPLLIVTAGVVVAVAVLGILLPLLTLVDALG